MNDEIEKFIKAGGLGLPVKTELAAMMKSNPQKSFGMDFLERQLLRLGTSRWNNPLVSASVQSGNPADTGGAPTAEEKGEELSPEGEASRDKDTNQK